PLCFCAPESIRDASTGRVSPRRATYFLVVQQESRQRSAPRRLGPSGFPRSGRFHRPVLNSLRSNSRTGLPRRNHPPLGEPEGTWVAATSAVTYTLAGRCKSAGHCATTGVEVHFHADIERGNALLLSPTHWFARCRAMHRIARALPLTPALPAWSVS